MNVKSDHGEMFTTELLDIHILNQVPGARAHTQNHCNMWNFTYN